MKICDSHTDFLTEIKERSERESYVKGIKSVANYICCSVFTTNSTVCLQDVENCKREIDFYNKKFKTKFLLTIEDLGFVKTKDELFNLVKLKPFSVTLTWNKLNQFAGGARTNKGLTKLGIKTIKLLEENNILVDTAHLSRKAFDQFAKITTKPIFNSHSNLNVLHEHKRNLTDEQIKEIFGSGGFVGLTIYEKFISDKKITAKDVAKQIDYVIKLVGYNNVGFGTDLYGIDEQFLPLNINSYHNFKQIAEELKKLNYSNKIIKAVFYKNFENFINKTN